MKKIYSILLCSAILFGFAASLSAQDLVAYYAFEGENGTNDSIIEDVSGNGHDIVTDCDSCWSADGKLEGSFYFQGNKGTLPAEDIALSTEEGSVAFWVLLPSSRIGSINYMWWAGRDGGDGFGPQDEMHIHTEEGPNSYWAGGELSFVVNDSVAGTRDFLFSDPTREALSDQIPPTADVIQLTDSVWHHIAVTWELGGQIALYIDGVTIWDSAFKAQNAFDLNKMTIGTANERTSRKMVGYMDELRIYDGALEASDITDIVSTSPVMNDELAVSIYPNPASDIINIKAKSNVAVTLHDVTGKLVYSESFAKNNAEINVSNLANGIYICTVVANDVTSTQRIVIE